MWFFASGLPQGDCFPRRPMFCTSFDFEKNKGLFLLALIAVVLNFLFHPPKASTIVCLYSPSYFFFKSLSHF